MIFKKKKKYNMKTCIIESITISFVWEGSCIEKLEIILGAEDSIKRDWEGKILPQSHQ